MNLLAIVKYSMFHLFKKKEKQIQINNELLGVLTFVEEMNNDCYWLAAKKFDATGQAIEYIIFNDINGPSKIQIDLCTDIEEKYDELIKSTEDLILKNYRDSKFKVGQTLRLSSISIPKAQPEKRAFSLTFELTKDFGFFDVEFELSKPISVSFSA